ncbi:hypothetical protein DENSPDRAFT_401718 [Dentipellis sp. KUC8613]|nr:hypothetical protein DENSPDRAFT_401718 [Dentipellis sp. KUC8613]
MVVGGRGTGPGRRGEQGGCLNGQQGSVRIKQVVGCTGLASLGHLSRHGLQFAEVLSSSAIRTAPVVQGRGSMQCAQFRGVPQARIRLTWQELLRDGCSRGRGVCTENNKMDVVQLRGESRKRCGRREDGTGTNGGEEVRGPAGGQVTCACSCELDQRRGTSP